MHEIDILVVDDEEGMRSAVQRALHGQVLPIPEVESEVRLQVRQAGSGEEALAILEASAPDILLLDYKLPDISGMKILERLPEPAKDSLVIMITAYASIETAVKATRQGAHDFLAKPFTPQELRHVVRKAAVRVSLSKAARRLAEEKKRVRFDFIRVLGHELKAPLGAVESYMDLLRRKTLGHELHAYDSVVERSSLRLEQMRKLIVDLLEMTKIESGQRTREIAEFDVLESAKQSLELLTPVAAQHSVTLQLTSQAPARFNGDRSEVDMILNNLISNAIKYNREQGSVAVAVSCDGEELTIIVSDTGIGMRPEDQKKLFGEFVRIKNDKTRNILGTGLGLSIIKRLAELNQGSIEVQSEVDKGSVFTVRLKSQQHHQ